MLLSLMFIKLVDDDLLEIGNHLKTQINYRNVYTMSIWTVNEKEHGKKTKIILNVNFLHQINSEKLSQKLKKNISKQKFILNESSAVEFAIRNSI